VTLRIGALGPEHAGEVLTVQRAAYLAEARRYRAFDLPPLTETLAEVCAELASPEVPAIGAWLGARLVGSVRGRPDGERMEIARLSVAPDVQGTGVGRALLTEIARAAPQRIRTLWLFTGAESVDNLRMYARAGYRVVREGTDAVGVAVVELEKAVDVTSA
jgi:GNAT superfamily N-acetyltransferase